MISLEWLVITGFMIFGRLAYAHDQYILKSFIGHDSSGLPVSHPTKSFWIDSSADANPLARTGSEGPVTSDADVCIIGSGITGVSTAYHLSNLVQGRKLKAVIFEARDFCSGATGRNGGHLTPGSYHNFRQRVESYGPQEAMKLIALENHTVHEILDFLDAHDMDNDVDLVSGGNMHILFTDFEASQVKADLIAATEAGIISDNNVIWMDKEVIQKMYGTSFPGIRNRGYNLWPLKLVTALYNHTAESPSLSLHLHTRTPVLSMHPAPPSTSDRRWLLRSTRGETACSYIVHATNAYASYLLPQFQGPEGIIPTRGQVIAVRAAVSAQELTRKSWIGNEGFEYWFPRPTAQNHVNQSSDNLHEIVASEAQENPLVIIGGGRETSGPRFEEYVTNDSEVNEQVGSALRKFLPRVFPGKFEEGKEPEMEWTGIMGFTKIGDPFVGPVLDQTGYQMSGQYVAAGYTGHGMPKAFACAEIVAQMINADLEDKEWIAPKWMPKHYLTTERSSIDTH